jgi:D-3-phosphoglycerate dehydrogenase / 2-oxoglutarate reductase
MKLLGIGDLFIPKDYIDDAFGPFRNRGIEIETIEWELESIADLQKANQIFEKSGCNDFEIPAPILKAVEDVDIIITQFFPVNRQLIDAAKKIKYVGVLRAGFENVDVVYASEKGILVFNTPGRNADAVADYTIGLLICECRNIARGHHGLIKGQWHRVFSNTDHIPDLPGKTVGIVGLGQIGQKVAQRLSGFQVKLLGYDPHIKYNDFGLEQVSLEDLMRKADFVTIHARYCAETDKLISKELIGLMKPTAYLINTSRPGLIDEEALYEALKEHRIAGAGLDVFNVEPPGKDYPMINLENVTVTPHMAGGSKDAFLNSPKKLALAMEKYLSLGITDVIVNKDTVQRSGQEFTA